MLIAQRPTVTLTRREARGFELGDVPGGEKLAMQADGLRKRTSSSGSAPRRRPTDHSACRAGASAGTAAPVLRRKTSAEHGGVGRDLRAPRPR